MEIFYQVICENQDNVAWCFVHAANVFSFKKKFVVLTILNNSSNPQNAKNKVLFGIKRYYIPVLGFSKIFCIFCLGLLASLIMTSCHYMSNRTSSACKALSASKTLNQIEPVAGMARVLYVYTVPFRLHCPAAYFT